jgi:hypothetical protein
MSRNLTLILTCALAFAACAPGHAQDSPSLGDLARQAQKDKANKPPAKVITNDDVSSAPGGISAALGKSAAQPGAAAKSEAPQTPAEAFERLQTMLDELAAMDRPTLVSNVLDGNTSNFPGRSKWEEKVFAAKQLYVTQTRDALQKARQLEASVNGMKGSADANDPRVKQMVAMLQQLMQENQEAGAVFQAVITEGKNLAALPDAH